MPGWWCSYCSAAALHTVNVSADELLSEWMEICAGTNADVVGTG